MNPLLPSSPWALNHSPPASSDVEMLQTDVMRFFAILCLCLMAIFALVKALPMSPPADRPTITPPPALKSAAAALENKIAALKAELSAIQARLSAATAAMASAKAQAADATAREQETRLRLSATRAELEAVSQALTAARRDIKTREAVLAGIVHDIETKQRVREELDAQIAIEEQKHQEIQTRLDQAAARLSRSAPPQQPAPAPIPAAPRPPPPARKGFTLRFASDTALNQLIKTGTVQFYALAGRKAWQLKTANGQPAFTTAPTPAEIYEMETSTVPASYTASFSRQVAAFGLGKITWGVALPEKTASAIQRLIQKREGGDLVIMPDGEVMLK